MPGAQAIIDIGGENPSVQRYWFLGVSGSVTAKGFFVKENGCRTGAAFSVTINQANGTNDPLQLSTSFPAGAVGAIIASLSGDVYYDILDGTAFATDFESNYANYPKILSSSTPVAIGRISSV